MIKFYNPLGKVCMTSDYFAGLVGAAAQSCYGVCGMATGGTSDSLKTIVLGTNYPDKGVRVTEEDGKLVIVQEGAKKKFVNKVEQITFSGDYANKVHQPVLYITERAVFELRPEGVTLVEIAPGIDLQTQVLDQMEFMPKIADDLKLMDERIFREELMGLAND